MAAHIKLSSPASFPRSSSSLHFPISLVLGKPCCGSSAGDVEVAADDVRSRSVSCESAAGEAGPRGFPANE